MLAQDEAKQLQRQLGESEGGRQAAERESAAKAKRLEEQAAAAAGVEKQLREEIQQLKVRGAVPVTCSVQCWPGLGACPLAFLDAGPFWSL